MSEVLFISPKELTQDTMMGGNVDVSKYLPSIFSTQTKVIEELLGTELYDKMLSDYTEDISTGKFIPSQVTGYYLVLLNEYIKPILKYESCADYITISPYVLGNGGLYKNDPEKAIQV